MTDHFFYLGENHRICQDYAFSSTDIACISDGVSILGLPPDSRPHPLSDVAARLVTMIAVTMANEIIEILSGLEFDTKEEEIEKVTPEILLYFKSLFPLRLSSITDLLDLPLYGLDATLGLLLTAPNLKCIYSIIIGDAILLEPSSIPDHPTIRYQSFKPNCPALASYILNPPKNVVFAHNDSIIAGNHASSPNLIYPEISILPHTSDKVFVSSDGLQQICDETGQLIELEKIANEILDFKSLDGPFVQKQLWAFIKRMRKRGWTFKDDLSLAGIIKP